MSTHDKKISMIYDSLVFLVLKPYRNEYSLDNVTSVYDMNSMSTHNKKFLIIYEFLFN